MSLSSTVLQDAIVIAQQQSGFMSYEQRLSNYGALQAFKDNADRLLPSAQVEAMRKSYCTPEKILVMNKFNSTIITAPNCNPTGAASSSAFYNLSWAFVGFEASIIPAVNQANYISDQADLANQMLNGWRAIWANMDNSAVNKLETSKNTSLVTSSKTAVINTVGNAYDYQGDPEKFWLYAPGLMLINDLQGPFNDVANSESVSSFLLAETLGQNNYQDLRAAFNGTLPYANGHRHYLTNRLAPGSHDESHFIFPDGTVGIYNWVDLDSKAGRTAGERSWGTMQDPYFGFEWSVFSRDTCTDASATCAGATRAYTEIMQIGAWFSYLTPYSSDSTSPIIKVNFDANAS